MAFRRPPLGIGFLALLLAACVSSESILPGNHRIVFFGDSITQLGVGPKGFVMLIEDSLRRKHAEQGFELIGAGVSGNKVTDLEKRLDHDVLDRHPSTVVIYIGINDVWHYALPNQKGTPKDEFESGLKEIITAIQRKNARVILCTPSVVGERNDGTNPQDSMLDEYSAISRRVAQESGAALCDLRQAFKNYLKSHNPKNDEKGILTHDRVHLNDEGNRFVAAQLLRFLGE